MFSVQVVKRLYRHASILVHCPSISGNNFLFFGVCIVNSLLSELCVFVYIASHITVSIFNTLNAYRIFYPKSKAMYSVFMLAFISKSLCFFSSSSRRGNTGGTNSIKDGGILTLGNSKVVIN